MAKQFGKMKLDIEVIFKISLWDAIKLRIAGREVRERILEIKEQTESHFDAMKGE